MTALTLSGDGPISGPDSRIRRLRLVGSWSPLHAQRIEQLLVLASFRVRGGEEFRADEEGVRARRRAGSRKTGTRSAPPQWRAPARRLIPAPTCPMASPRSASAH